jgi:hypothetical protein
MEKDPKSLEKLNEQAKQAIDQTKEQVLGAVDNYFNFLQKTVSSYPSGGTEFGEKLKSYAAKNIAATHEFIRKLSQAKDFQQIIQIQTEFLQTQMNGLGEQSTNLGEAYTKAAAGAVTPFKSSLD